MSRNRRFLSIQPLGTSRRLALHQSKPSRGTRVAEMDGATQEPGSDVHGWLTRLKNGVYVIEMVNGGSRNIDQRKAAAALSSLEKNQES